MATVEFRYDPNNTAWFTANAAMVLKAGEPAYHDTTGLFKLGDGVTALSALSFLPTVSASTPTIQQVLTAGQVATTTIETTGFIKTGGLSTQFLKADGTVDSNVYGVGNALTSNPLSQFAATTSAQLAGVISDETGSGALVFGTSPTFTTDITTPQITGVSGVNGIRTITNNTASGAIARGVYHTPTLVASANSDVLVGLDISTTFTNGAFTGVVNYGARISGRISQTGLGSSTFFGDNCGISDDLSANVNCAFGTNSLLSCVTGANNCAFGFDTLRLSTVSNNTAFGYSSQRSNTTGQENTSIGYNALFTNSTTAGNTAVGSLSLYQTTGANNTGVGKNALYDLAGGTLNTAIGYNTGRGITTGGSNTIIGAGVTGLSSSLANNVIISDGAGNKVLWFNSANALISDLKIDTTTGIKIGTATTQKIGFWNASPVVQPAAVTTVQGFYNAMSSIGLIASGTITLPTGYGRSFNNIAINTTGAAAANTDYYYFCTSTLTFTLPTAVGNTNTYYIKVTSGTLTIDTTSSQTIDGSLTIVTSVANTAFTLISDGTNWQII